MKKNVQAYKFTSIDNSNITSFVLDFLVDENIGSHKYYLVTCGDEFSVKKISSIDEVIGYFDRKNYSYSELNTKQAIKVLFSAINESINKNIDSVYDFPGVSPLNDIDKIILDDELISKKNLGGDKHGKK